jgi:hypothetical protein
MYGAKYVGRMDGGTVPVRQFVAKSSETITKGDWLSIDTAGLVDVAGADEPLLGVANQTVTGDGTKTVEVILALPGTMFLMDNDNDTETFAIGDQGEWHAIVGSTGAQQVNTNVDAEAPSSTVNQLVCLEYNPKGYRGGIYDADTSIGLYTPAYTYFTASYTE